MDVMMLSLADLSDQDLLARTMHLAADERRATALLIAHLAELDARRPSLAEGSSSLFTYCTQVLRLSEHAAYGRIAAARAARRFPLLLEMLGAGSVTLTTVAPLAPQRYKVQFTARAETYTKLRLAQDLLRHQIPDGDLDQILSRALTALLEDLARQKCAATDRPRGGRPTAPGSRHIPAEVKRAVWLRDAGRCVFVGASGRRCTATGFLEFHHVKPHAVGGES